MGHTPGPDVIIEHISRYESEEKVDAVMFVESEVGHDIGGAREYLKKLCNRLKPLLEDYRKRFGKDIHLSIVVITNAPRRLTEYLRTTNNRKTLEKELKLNLVEGWNIFIVPVLVTKDVLPAIFVRTMGTTARFI